MRTCSVPGGRSAGGGAALYYFKFRKPKEDVKDGDDLAEYDFGYDEDDEEEAPEPDDAQEPEEDWLIEKEAPEQNKEDEE